MEFQEIKLLRGEGKTYKQISQILILNKPNVRGVSERSVRRFCKDNNIPSPNVTNAELELAVNTATKEVHQLLPSKI